MGKIYGYIRTSRRKVDGEPGSDPFTQQRQLYDAGVPVENIYSDVGVSGATGTNTRKGWRLLDSRLRQDDVLVVAAVDRIGRGWIDTVSALRDLRSRKVRIRSLSPSEQEWTAYFDADPDSPNAVIGDILATFMTWAAQRELESIRERTNAGLARAKAAGKRLGPPVRMTEEKQETAIRLRRDGLSHNKIAKAIGVSRTTVSRHLQVKG